MAYALLLALSSGACGGSSPDPGGERDAGTDATADAEPDPPDRDSGPSPVDRDEDGYEDAEAGGDDCDDGNAAIHPGADERPGERITETVEDDLADASLVSIAASEGRVWLTYSDAGGDGVARAATRDAGDWIIDRLGQGADPAVALDSAGQPWVVTCRGSLSVLRLEAGEWTSETVAFRCGDGWAIAVDDDVVHLATVSVVDATVTHHWEDGDGRWQSEVIGPAGFGQWRTSIAAVGGITSIAYQAEAEAGEGQEIRLASDGSGQWLSEVVDEGFAVEAPALAIGRDDWMFVAYEHISEGELRLAARHAGAGEWEHEVVDDSRDDGARPEDPAVAVDAQGHQHVAFESFGLDRSWVIHATRAARGWALERVDDTAHGPVTGGTSVALAADESGVHLAYTEPAEGTWVGYSVRPSADGVDQDCNGADL